MNQNYLDLNDAATVFVLFLEGKMDGIVGFNPEEFETFSDTESFPEVGEDGAPTKALLFKGGSISLISGKSGDLYQTGFEPFSETHFNTQYALTITNTLATFHATLKAMGKQSLSSHCQYESKVEDLCQVTNESFLKGNYSKKAKSVKDDWTAQISKKSLVKANLGILLNQFHEAGVSSRITDKLESLKNDIGALTKFLQFASALQSETRLQSIGPVCMCDIWVPQPSNYDSGEEILVIRLRGGPNLQAPPLRDTAWVWLTLLRPDILLERYMELCESYCSTYNTTLTRLSANTSLDELTLFDIMRDLGESFLHGFLTIVHKFIVSGIWSFDRKLFTQEGIHSLADAIGFLVDNGIIGSLFIA